MKRLLLAVLLLSGCAEPEAHDARGRECLARGDLKCAVSAFSDAVVDAPSVPRYRYNLAVALAKMGALEQARSELEIAVALDPADIRSRSLLQRVHRAIAVQNARLLIDG